MMIKKIKRWMIISFGIVCIMVLSRACLSWNAIRVVSANADVEWAKDSLSKLLLYCSSAGVPVGLPEDINIQHLPNDADEFVQALSRLPNTVRTVTLNLGNDPIAPKILDKVIDMKGVSELIVLGCPVTDDSLARITATSSLRSLILSGNQQSFHQFSSNSQVETLELDATMLDMEGLNRVLDTRTLKKLSIVENAIDFNSLLKLKWNSSSLETLVLGHIGEVTADEIHLLVDTIKKGCPKIEAVFLNNQNVAK